MARRNQEWAENCLPLIGGIIDQIDDGKNGLLVPPGDPAALRQAMTRLIADPPLLARMGEAARRKVVEFQSSTVVSRIEEVYWSLCPQSMAN